MIATVYVSGGKITGVARGAVQTTMPGVAHQVTVTRDVGIADFNLVDGVPVVKDGAPRAMFSAAIAAAAAAAAAEGE